MRQAREFAAQSHTKRHRIVDYNPAWPFTFRDGERTYTLKRGLVSGNLFATLGERSAFGQLLAANDDRVGAEPVAVISFGLRRRLIASDASAIGRRLTLHANGRTYTAIGVAPRGLD